MSIRLCAIQEQAYRLGRLVPAQATGVQYEVHYGIHEGSERKKQRRGRFSPRWTECSLRLANSQQVPDGSYFLYADDGKIRQLKRVSGRWQYLARVFWRSVPIPPPQ